MPEPQWAVFVGITAVVLTLLLALARLSQSMVREDHTPPGRLGGLDSTHGSDGATQRTRLELSDPVDALDADDLTVPGRDVDGSPARETAPASSPGALTAEELAQDPFAGGPDDGNQQSPDRPRGPAERQVAETEREATITTSTGALLANVALTQGVFGVLVLGAAVYASIPASAFGVTADPLSTGLPGLAIGLGLGVALYAANEVGAAGADAIGVEYDERLRSLLAPDSAGGWALLLLGVLPVIAGVEELIFRAAVVGVTSAGFGTSPWALAVVSSLAFALGHGAQGRVGIVVTGGLGFVLAAAFILTGTFLVVFVAHYVVNALEFLVHELLGIEWTGGESE